MIAGKFLYNISTGETKESRVYMSRKTIRIGVFGMARGRSFVKSFRKIRGVKVVAVCETNGETLQKARDLGILDDSIPVYSDFDEFIDCGLDAVVLCNFFHEHAKYAKIALEKKIHVLSETTAAPTLKECVELCQAVEKSHKKYLLANNSSWSPGAMELRNIVKSGVLGQIFYGEGEYMHPWEDRPNSTISNDPSKYTHWRKHLPRTYYNMHSLGVLMFATESVPVKVSGKYVYAPEFCKRMNQPYNGDVHGIAITEMDNGAVFTSTGCSSLGPKAKWYRLSGENGNAETLRYDETGVRIDYMKYAIPEEMGETQYKLYYPDTAGITSGVFTEKELKDAGEIKIDRKSTGHHGGNDYWICLYFIKYLRNEVKDPFFNVYRACALSAAGILSFRSAQNGGKEYEIPDFTNKRTRRKYLKDDISPFPREDGSFDVEPCSHPEYDVFKQN